jgi:lysine N6-hydroxylase
METVFDITGIGIGPFNLGLAALCTPIRNLKCIFFDRRKSFSWHPGMLIPGSTMQVSFLADLVTLADPTSPFSYLKFLKNTGRLIQFGIHEHNYITRSEYTRYCQWVSNQLNCLRYNQSVEEISYDSNLGNYIVTYIDQYDGKSRKISTKNVVIGIGSEPFVPDFAKHAFGKRVIHSSEYEFYKHEIKLGNIAIIGSGQSAAEIFYDQLTCDTIDRKELSWFTRSPGFLSMENTKFAYELSTPDYIDYFFNLPVNEKDGFLKKQDYFYKGINEQLINTIYDILYERMAEGKNNHILMMANTEAREINDGKTGSWNIRLHQYQQGKEFYHQADWIILATGYQSAKPGFLSPLETRISHDNNTHLKISRNYLIEELNGIYIQNGELHSHGFSAADLSLGAYRNAVIINSILK